MTVTPEQKEAIGRLQYTRDGKMLVECLQTTIVDLSNRIAMDDDMHRVRMFQGNVRTLRELIGLLTPVSS